MAEQPADADVAQLVERNLAKVEVASSNLVIRSVSSSDYVGAAFFVREIPTFGPQIACP